MTKKFSYEKFWDNLDELSSTQLIEDNLYLKPQNRSSTIFPLFFRTGVETKIQFLSYWLKKHGNKVVIRLTRRNLNGEILNVDYKIITSYKANTFNISYFLDKEFCGFCGSLEIEVFSKSKPLFSFPAISLSFSDINNTSVVHSCIRTYNKNESINEYSLFFPQTGFDVDFNNGNNNYICFFGGKKKTYNLKIELSENNFLRVYKLKLKNNLYGKSHIIYLEDLVEENDKKLFNSPKCSIIHDLDDVFPRFYVGIINPKSIPTLTHTFFDTSKNANSYKDMNEELLRAKNTNPNDYFDSALSIPIFPINKFSTSLRSYAQNLEIKGMAFFSVYSIQGQKLFNRKLSDLELKDLSKIGDLDLVNIINEASLSTNVPYSLTLSFVNNKLAFPLRFKLGLNIKRKEMRLGSNICFSPKVINESLFSKPFSRRWFPLGGSQKFIATIHNTSFSRFNLNTKTKYKLEFINHKGELMNQEFNLKPNESLFINPSNDSNISEFLENSGGWCMTTGDTYSFDSYYFSMSDKLIGGDHAF